VIANFEITTLVAPRAPPGQLRRDASLAFFDRSIHGHRSRCWIVRRLRSSLRCTGISAVGRSAVEYWAACRT